MRHLFLIPSAVALCTTLAAFAESVKVDFVRDIQPLFEKRCYECHDHRKVKGGLRLDIRDAFLRGGDSGKAPLLIGKGAESMLVKRLTSKDEDEVMPPKGDRLTAEQVALIQAWIDQGAVWPDSAAAPKPHWSYVKPSRPARPAVKNAAWPRNDLDSHVLARLEKEGLTPSPEADRPTLIRRVSLDLTGLPPSPAEVNDFVADPSRDAYEKVVDRLLASPHYGERWARPWLDMARYADTQGYEKDNRRSIWPYRDWVISAFNRNLPFDRFSIEQIAGDLLPDATPEQRIATGFHRNTMTNTEGGTDDEEFRHEAIVDRINTTYAVWMGSTMNCAQCHNHKYDPLTMRDFYGAYAILNQTADADQNDDAPFVQVGNREQSRRKAELEPRVAELEKLYRESTPEFSAARSAYEQRQRDYFAAWTVLRPNSAKSIGGATLKLKDDGRFLVEGPNPTNDTYVLNFTTPFPRVTGLRLEVLPDDSMGRRSFGRAEDGIFILSRLEVTAAPRDNPAAAQLLKAKSISADGSRGEFDAASLMKEDGKGWSLDSLRETKALHVIFENSAEFPAGTVLSVTLKNASSQPKANLGSFRLAAAGLQNPPIEHTLAPGLIAALRRLEAQRSTDETRLLDDHFRSSWEGWTTRRDELTKARNALDQLNREIPTTLVFAKVGQPRETFFRIRGGYLTKGDRVDVGVPPVWHAPDTNAPLDRLGFARWLVSPNNPLTARVQVNRYWEQLFGRGIVETTEEFGKQGEPPSNPELLDWLATEFMQPTVMFSRTGQSAAQPWDIKHLLKVLVMSATYRQSSKPAPELLERDPLNRLLARGPRVRLEAEMVRDQALAASGLLSDKIGGPSVMPRQPDGIWQVVYSGDQWITSAGEDQYRRSLYTFWRRSSPPPMMVNFDAPSREFCVLKRNRSNTPLQALNLLNDPACLEFAQALARRVVHEGGDNLDARIAFAFQACVARPPKEAERARLKALFEAEFARFRDNASAAEKMATHPLGPPAPGQDLSELAAWTVLANVLLNLDEMVTKG